MINSTRPFGHFQISIKAITLSAFFFLGVTTVPTFAGELSVEFETIARSNTTPVPNSTEVFLGFGEAPAVDDSGNVVFIGGGSSVGGVYTSIGFCCQKVADTNTAIPGGGGATFANFYGSELPDIDDGRIAFKALNDSFFTGLYTNVGQSAATSLVEITVIDGGDWADAGGPWVDGNTVAMYGERPQFTQPPYEILLWDAPSQSISFVNPGTGYNLAYNSQASVSDGAAILGRYKTGSYQLVVSSASGFQVVATADVTEMPDLGGATFSTFYDYPVIEAWGDDVLFLGAGGQVQGLFKRVNNGPLMNVADTTTTIPESGGDVFGIIAESAISLANGQAVFYAAGQYFLRGIYTDIGGQLSVLLDNESNNTILLDGQPEQVTSFSLSTRSFAHTPQGYMVVFRAYLASGGSAVIRATINEEPGGGTDDFTVYKDFSDNSNASVSVTLSCSSGTVTNNPQFASEGSPAVFTITGASPGAVCTAQESVPAGYSADQSDCQNGDPLNGSCTIVNTLVQSSASFWVFKDFTDDNTDSVTVYLSCTSGTVTNNPQLASEASIAHFNIVGASPGATCSATENPVPPGYTADEIRCNNGDPLNGSCLIINTPIPGTGIFTVNKDFTDNSSASVSVTLSCTSGTVTNNPQLASEASPAVFNISGASPGATCTAVESVPSGYTANQTDCQNGDPLNGSCIIVNTPIPSSNSFTVNKDFTNNSSASVSVTLSCTSGTVTNNPQLASEASPAVFNISGASPGATCTAVESVPSGYTANQTDCQNGDPLNGNCTIVNTPISSSNSFTVYNDFSDDNAAGVIVTLSCTNGTVTNNPQPASEASPAVFNISGASAGTTCTATGTVPSGYVSNQSDCQNGDSLNGSCLLVNTFVPPAQEVVILNEGFEDGNSNGWTTNGTVNVNGQQAIGQYSLRHRRSSSSERGVSTLGYSGVRVDMRLAGTSLENGDDCFAEVSTGGSWINVVEVNNGSDNGTFFAGTVSPAGASNNSDLRLRFRSTGGQNNDYCWGDEVKVFGTPGDGTAGSFIVRKDFSDNNSSGVMVSLSCSSGTVTNSPQVASEASPAVFYIQGQSPGTTCTATESVPSGYTANQSDCQDGDPVNGMCTIINTPVASSDSFTVIKDFTDNSSSSVNITLSCTSGTVTNNPRQASESSPAIFNISGASPGATCTAVESVPSGYTANQSDCQNGDPLNGNCTIVNTPVVSTDSFTVFKNFTDNNSSSVNVTLSCTSGTVTNNPRLASESSPAVFEISGAAPGATCTAVESVPSGYTANQSDCQNGDPLNGNCTIVNTPVPSMDSFTVLKDFSDNNATSVSITLTCNSGSVTNNPQTASESSPAVFEISGAAPGATCTAVESVPSGYVADESDCQDGDPINSSCTIVNNLDIPPEEEIIEAFDFENGNTSGWSTNGSVSIDGILAIGQYSLRHAKGTSSEIGVSTVGFEQVNITMHLAGASFKKTDRCLAEVSTNGGSNWTTVVEVDSDIDNSTFYSGTISHDAADDNSNLRLRFVYDGNGKGGFCYGDSVVVSGTPF